MPGYWPPVRIDPIRLTNLDHLDWLRDCVAPGSQSGHTTYQLDREPAVEMVWTYAEQDPDGAYRRVGGGAYDAATNRYGQGAFNADDVARAAVVYLRHWRATGADTSRRAAYGLLRGLTYLQTERGTDAGNVVLWMQPDGTLEPSADPPDLPDPSDSAESCWLARTVWALGEGYVAFRGEDPRFADFLRNRLTLALAAIERQSLSRYGRWLHVDGQSAPAWLIDHGADVTGEALLGLAPYVEATGNARARVVLDRLTEGVAAMGGPASHSWPYGAVMPSARTPSRWHAWGGLAPAGLARAYRVNGSVAARDAALADSAAFTPLLLVAAGPANAWLRDSADHVQIAYGAHSRLESLLTVAGCADRPGLVALAGVAASWFFGNNPAGQPVYDPASGRTFDGIDPPGVRNGDAGAESTLHGLLAMLALDANPEAAAIARVARVRDRRAVIPVRRHRHRPESPAGPAVVSPGPAVVSAGPAVALAVDRASRRASVTDVGARGLAPLERELAWLALDRPDTDDGVLLVRGLAESDRHVALVVPGDGPALVRVYDTTGRVLSDYVAETTVAHVVVPGGGFALARRNEGGDPF